MLNEEIIQVHARAVSQPEVNRDAQTGLGHAILNRLKLFNTFWDSRFEDLTRETWIKTTYRDMSAGLIVALTAIPMAMGFAMANGLRPEQGIIAGAMACLIGRTWGGSKYQVYGPTAAFIPVIAWLMAKYGEAGGGTAAEAHGFLVFVSIIAGVILMLMGVFGLGKYAKLVPNSIIVGFTVGIAVAIAMTNIESILGIEDFKDLLGEDEDLKGGFIHNVLTAFGNLDMINGWSLAIGLMTFILTKGLLRISIFIPAPLLAIALSTVLAATVMAGKGVILVKDIYGSIPNNFFVFTPPVMPELTSTVMFDIFYFVFAIVFVSAVESVLCSSMADRMAGNTKTPFNPDKEFWGQGLVQIITPVLNGFPCTGALARTATSIKAGAVTPLAGYFKAFFKLALAYYIASYLEMVPMACIGGILLWVASNMIKVKEIKEVLNHNKFHSGLMIYTAIMVPVTDFLTGVLSALVIYALGFKFFDKPETSGQSKAAEQTTRVISLEQSKASPQRFDKVMVPLSLADNDSLLNYAAHLAKMGMGKEFNFIHVVTPHARPGQFNSAAQMKQRMAEAVSRSFGDTIGNLKINCHVFEASSVLDKLVEFSIASASRLIVSGHENYSTWRRALPMRLAMLTNCSVWMVPAHAKPVIERIIAPIDFSKASEETLSQALMVAKANDIKECMALHIYCDDAVIRYDEYVKTIRGNEETAFSKFMGLIQTRDVKVMPKFFESVNVAQAIVGQAQAYQADLIVLGTRGQSQASSILLGSVASEVMSVSDIPVLAIKHAERHQSFIDALFNSKFWAHSYPKAS